MRYLLTTILTGVWCLPLSAAQKKAEGLRAFDLDAPVAEVAVAADGKRAWVLHATEPRLIAVSLDKPTAGENIALPAVGASLTEAAGKVFVAARRSGSVAVLDAATLKFAGQIELRAAALRRVLSAPAGDAPRVVAVGVADDSLNSAAVAFVIDPAKPETVRGIRLADNLREFDASVSADGRYLYLWRTDASPSGVQVFDLAKRKRVFADPRLSGPVAPDPAGWYAATRSGDVFTADFGARVGDTGGGPAFWHPSRPLLMVAASEPGLFSSDTTLPGAMEIKTLRILSAGTLQTLQELTGLPPMAIVSPQAAPGAGAVLWLTARPRSDTGPVVIGGNAIPPAVLVTLPLDADKVPDADTLRVRRRPPGSAVAGRPYQTNLAGAVAAPLAGGLKFVKTAGPAGLEVAADGAVRYTPGLADVGSHEVQVRATDGAGKSIRLAWSLQVEMGGYDLAGETERRDPARPPVAVLSADGRELYSLSLITREVAVRDAVEGTVLRHARPSAAPVDLDLSNGRLLLLDEGDSAIHVLDPATLKPQRSIPLPKIGAYALAVPAAAPDTAVVIGRRDRDYSLIMVNLTTGAALTLGRPGFGGAPAASPDGRLAYVTSDATRSAGGLELYRLADVAAAGGPVEPIRPALARLMGRKAAVDPVDGRLFVGRSAVDPELTARVGELPGELSVPHPNRAVALSVATEAGTGIRIVALEAAGSTEPDPYLPVTDATVKAERTPVALVETAGFTSIGLFSVPLPGPADDVLWDAGGHTALLRCGTKIVRLPLPAEAIDARRHFDFVGRPPERAAIGAEFRFRPRLFEPPPGAEPAFALVEGPAGMSVDPRTGELSWTPARRQVGRHFVSLEARAGGRSARLRFSLSAEAPKLTLPRADYTGAAVSGDGARLVLWRRGDTKLTVIPTAADGDKADAADVDAGGPIRRVLVLDDLAFVVTEGADTVRIFDLTKRDLVNALVLKSPPTQITRRPGTREVYLADEDGAIRRLDPEAFVDLGVVAKGRTFGFAASGKLLYALAPAARLGFEVPTVGTPGGGMILITGSKEDEAQMRRPTGSALKVHAAGDQGRSGPEAWVTWMYAPDEVPARPSAPGSAALRPGVKGEAAAQRDATVFGGPGSPWRLLDAVTATDSPDNFAPTPDGGSLLYVHNGVVKAVRAGDPSALQATITLRARDSAGLPTVEAAVALAGRPAGGVFVLGRSGRVYAFRKELDTPLLEPIAGTAAADADPSAARPAAAAPSLIADRGDRPVGGRADQLHIEVIGARPGADPAAQTVGLALAAAGNAKAGFVCRGREALRFDADAPAIPDNLRALTAESSPPSDHSPGELIHYQPKVAGAAPVHMSLHTGPDGMHFNAHTGTLVWDVPAAGGPDVVRVVLLFKDRLGRIGFQSFVMLKTGTAIEKEK